MGIGGTNLNTSAEIVQALSIFNQNTNGSTLNNSFHARKFSIFLMSADFFKITFSKNSFGNTIWSVKQFEPRSGSMVFLKEFFVKVGFEKDQQTTKIINFPGEKKS